MLEYTKLMADCNVQNKQRIIMNSAPDIKAVIVNIDAESENEAEAITRSNTYRLRCTINRPKQRIKIKGICNEPKRIVTSLTRKRRKTMATENETREAKFVRLATKRASKALKSISQIGNLSTAAYCYMPEQIAELEAALYSEVEATMAKFNKASVKAEKGFSFSS